MNSISFSRGRALFVSTERFEIIYEGDAVSSGKMDVRDLAPALLALGNLCSSANNVLNGKSAEVSVHVRSDFKEGSFEVVLEIGQAIISSIPVVSELFDQDHVKDPYNILLSLGLIVSNNVPGLIDVLLWLKNRNIQKAIRNEDGSVTLIADNGGQINITQNVFNLSKDKNVREELENTYKPLETGGIESIKTRKNKQDMTEIQKGDFEYFKAPENLDEIIQVVESPVIWEIVRPSFSDSLMWTLTDGERNFFVKIEDEKFIEDVEAGKIVFRKGDIIKGIIKIITKSTNNGIRADYVLVKVDSISPNAQQIEFDDPDDE